MIKEEPEIEVDLKPINPLLQPSRSNETSPHQTQRKRPKVEKFVIAGNSNNSPPLKPHKRPFEHPFNEVNSKSLDVIKKEEKISCSDDYDISQEKKDRGISKEFTISSPIKEECQSTFIDHVSRDIKTEYEQY